MGEIADMMLDGTMCQGCGEWLGEPQGFPGYCSACAREIEPFEPSKKRRRRKRKAKKEQP